MKRKFKLSLFLLIAFLLFVAGTIIWFSVDKPRNQEINNTSGDFSPIIENVNGNVTIGTDSTGPRNEEESIENNKQ